MARNENSKQGPFLANSKGTLRYQGSIPDYGKVTNERSPVSSNRSVNAPTGTDCGNVKHVRG